MTRRRRRRRRRGDRRGPVARLGFGLHASARGVAAHAEGMRADAVGVGFADLEPGRPDAQQGEHAAGLHAAAERSPLEVP
jgi:hypothetical protein